MPCPNCGGFVEGRKTNLWYSGPCDDCLLTAFVNDEKHENIWKNYRKFWDSVKVARLEPFVQKLRSSMSTSVLQGEGITT